ncbi:MAG: hypothetical protein JNK58_12300 [Phycisphaerae bacterium]|nr:hypothetical protein [Phycisphaerae bacterium]
MTTTPHRLNGIESRMQLLESRLLERADQQTTTHKYIISLSKILISLLGLCFIILTAYQLTKAESLWRLLAEVEAQKSETASVMNEVTKIGVATARACNSLNNGYIELARGQARQSLSHAEEAAATIDAARKAIRSRSDLLLGLDQLDISAMNLKSRCYFKLRDWSRLSRAADEIIRIDPGLWLGYHYRGLYKLSVVPGDPAAKADLETSLFLLPAFNPDRFNLLEVAFFDADYPLVRRQMQAIYSEYPEFCEAIRRAEGGDAADLATDSMVVLELYARLAAISLREESDADHRLCMLLAQLKKHKPSFEGKFDDSALRAYITSAEGRSRLRVLAASSPMAPEALSETLGWILKSPARILD